MEATATTYKEVIPDVFEWEVFSPEHKVELTSHAVKTDNRIYVFDPIPLAAGAMSKLLADAGEVVLVLTNGNHERAITTWLRETGAQVWAAEEAYPEANHWSNDTRTWGPWELLELSGGAAGEMAFKWRERGLVVFGDAVFNLPGYGFGVLPPKYCRNAPQLRRELAQLARDPFSTALMAHGSAVLPEASRRIANLF